MTLEKYIFNPMGQNNASNTPLVREAIKNSYKHRFDNLMLRENGVVKFYLYYDSANNIYYAHIKVPSEAIEDFYYDTVFKFTTTADRNTASGKDLEKYDVKFFSNDPAFVYTHAHTYLTHGLFIEELSPRMSKEALNKPATVTNPNDSIGYVKSIYFAYLYMKHRGLFKTISYSGAQPFHIKLLAANIMPADQKIALREDAERKRDKRKKVVIDQDTAKRLSKYNLSDRAKDRLVTTTKTTAKIKNTKAVNTIKKAKKK